jgi:hypothetical protein
MNASCMKRATAAKRPTMTLETIERVHDYSYRTLSNSAYVSPTRGQQIAAPADLEERVGGYLAEHPASPRDETVEALSDAEDLPDDARTEAPR